MKMIIQQGETVKEHLLMLQVLTLIAAHEEDYAAGRDSQGTHATGTDTHSSS